MKSVRQAHARQNDCDMVLLSSVRMHIGTYIKKGHVLVDKESLVEL